MQTYTITTYDPEDYKNFRKTLNNEKAADILERIESGWIGGYSFTGTESDFDLFTLHAALDYAIDVLRK